MEATIGILFDVDNRPGSPSRPEGIMFWSAASAIPALMAARGSRPPSEEIVFWSAGYVLLALAAVSYQVAIFKNNMVLFHVFIGAIFSSFATANWTISARYFNTSIASVCRRLSVVCFVFAVGVAICAALASILNF